MDFRKNNEIVSTFIDETIENLMEIENGILRMEAGREIIDETLVHKMFRAAHSIKAGANLLHARNIELLAHSLENVLQLLRQGKMVLNHDMVDILLKSIDQVRTMTNNFFYSDEIDVSPLAKELTELAKPTETHHISQRNQSRQ